MSMSPRTRIALIADPGSRTVQAASLSLTEPTPMTGTMPCLRELRSEALHGFLRESAEHQRSLDRLQIVGIAFAGCESTELAQRRDLKSGWGCEPPASALTVLLPGLRSMALISSISAMGVTPAIGSLENSPMRKASAPASLPFR